MATKRQQAAPPLDGELLEILLLGPNAVGRTLNTMGYTHDELRAVWAAHAPDVRAEASRRGIAVWFELRDRFVAYIQEGVPLVDPDEDEGV